MSKEDRFALLNTLRFNDKFFDNENVEYLDSLDVVKILNHYDKTLSEFVKREVEKQDKIADLEAKLAEREEAIKYLKGIKRYDIGEMLVENTQLKQQLAEKDEEIEDVKAVLFAQKLDKEYTQILAIQNCEQEKISFAVEQLRKAKFDALMLGGVVQGETFFINSKHYRNYIDNQIEELKKGVE